MDNSKIEYRGLCHECGRERTDLEQSVHGHYYCGSCRALMHKGELFGISSRAFDWIPYEQSYHDFPSPSISERGRRRDEEIIPKIGFGDRNKPLGLSGKKRKEDIPNQEEPYFSLLEQKPGMEVKENWEKNPRRSIVNYPKQCPRCGSPLVTFEGSGYSTCTLGHFFPPEEVR